MQTMVESLPKTGSCRYIIIGHRHACGTVPPQRIIPWLMRLMKMHYVLLGTRVADLRKQILQWRQYLVENPTSQLKIAEGVFYYWYVT